MFLPSLIPAMRFVLPLDVLHRTMDGRSVSADKMRSSLRPGPAEHFLTTGLPVRTTGHRRRRRSSPLNPPSPTRGDSPISRSATPPEPSVPPSPTHSTDYEGTSERATAVAPPPPPTTAHGRRRHAASPHRQLSADPALRVRVRPTAASPSPTRFGSTTRRSSALY